MKQEPAAGGLAYPNCVLDDFNVKPDTDADGLWDEEEVAVASGGTGTDPLLQDSGIPGKVQIDDGRRLLKIQPHPSSIRREKYPAVRIFFEPTDQLSAV